MTKLITTIAAIPLSALGFAAAESRSFDIEGFTGVRSTSGVEVEVTVGESFSVTLETEADAEEASVERRGDVLVLGRESRRGMGWNFGRGNRFVYTVTMPALGSASSSAGSEMRVRGIDTQALTLEASSGSELDAEGRCGRLEAEASSGSDINAFGLSCEDVRARASSGADIEITATRSIDGKASSGADIDVRGNPERRNTSKSSGGDVNVS